MSTLWASKVMEGIAPLDQAKRAIAYALQQVADNKHIGWHAGVGTQSFALLTEAAATLYERPIEEVRKRFAPDGSFDPNNFLNAVEEASEQLCGRDYGALGDASARAELGLKLRAALEEYKR